MTFGDKLSGWEQGLAVAAIFGGPLVKGAIKVGKGAINTGKEILGQVKNVLHSDKVKGIANKVFNDYIKSPLQKGYTYFKDYTKKLGDVKTPLTYEAATPLSSTRVLKTVSEVAQDLKESAVQMAKKLDEAIGGKNADEGIEKGTKAETLAKNREKGRVFEQAKLPEFEKTADNIVEQVTIKTNKGTKIRIDAIGTEKTTSNIVIQEYKSSTNAPLTKTNESFSVITK